MDSPLSITRETAFYQGQIRFKMSVANISSSIVADVSLDFVFDENLLYIEKHDDLTIKKGKFVLGNIYGGKDKTFTIYFEPLTCAKASDIGCQVNYRDHEGKMASVWMEPKEISVVCPIIKTDQDINIGRLKDLIETLPYKDSRVYQLQSGFNVKKLATIAREVVEKHDVKHIRTLHSLDGKTCEIWYYAKTKVSKEDIIINVSILTEHNMVELFAATQTAESLTGLLAEIGRDLKQTLEAKVSGQNRVVNLTIKDSVIQRSNLLDMCSIDGSCDVNVVIEDSVVQRSGIASANEEAKRRQEEQKRKEAERLRKEQEERAYREQNQRKPSMQKPVSAHVKKAPKKGKSFKKKFLSLVFILIIIFSGYKMISGDTETINYGNCIVFDLTEQANDVTVDSSGQIYVASGDYILSNGTIQKLDSGGSCITNLTLYDSGMAYNMASDKISNFVSEGYDELDENYQASGIVVDTSGNIFVLCDFLYICHDSSYSSKFTHVYLIQKYKSNGAFITEWPSAMNADMNAELHGTASICIAVDPSGNVYVNNYNTSNGNWSILKYDNNGNFITKWDRDVTDMDIDSSGNIYTTHYNSNFIKKYDSNGILITEWECNNTPEAIAVDVSNHVYTIRSSINKIDYDEVRGYDYYIQKYDTNGNFIKEDVYHTGYEYLCDGEIAVDNSGNIYYCTKSEHALFKFS